MFNALCKPWRLFEGFCYQLDFKCLELDNGFRDVASNSSVDTIVRPFPFEYSADDAIVIPLESILAVRLSTCGIGSADTQNLTVVEKPILNSRPMLRLSPATSGKPKYANMNISILD